jgi:hypothetical protein
MQKGVRVWYFGAAGTGMSSDAEEAYLFASIDGNTAQLTHHSAINHWGSPNAAETETGSILDKGPCWIHPQKLQTLKNGDDWQGHEIVTVLPDSYTYDTFKNEFPSIPYLLLPIKALFDLKPQRNLVKIVYMIEGSSTGIAYFDADTGLLLFRENSTGYAIVFFILSEINYDFANQKAFAEDNGPHTGFKSNIIKTSSASHVVNIQSSVETRYGNTVQMWVTTLAGGSINIYMPPNENYCFFGSEPVLRRKDMTATPNYPPEGWNEYGEYLWWWAPQEALQSSSINILNAPMTRTSTAPYTFAAVGVGTGLYFSNIIFDNDGYMTDFSARYSAIGLVIDLGASASPWLPIHLVDGLEYYRNTMGRATPAAIETVSVTATDAYASEAGPTTGTFRISRAGSTSANLSVYFTMSGAATNGADYTTITSPMAIPAGALFVDILVTPIGDTTVEGDELAVLTILTNAGYTVGSANNAAVTISEEPVGPKIFALPVSNDFGFINIGSQSAPQTFEISNTGDANLFLDAVTLSGTDVSDFRITGDTCSGTTVLPSEKCIVQVAFSSTSQGVKNGNLSIPSNDPDTPSLAVALTGEGTSIPEFDDCQEDYWAEDFVNTLYYSGITTGCSANPPLFCPETAITRAQMAVFIEASLGHPPNNCTGRFTDVPVGNPFCGFIERMADDGITGGCGDGIFCPDSSVTRSQMAVFIEAALGRSPAASCTGRFGDVNGGTVGDIFCRYIEDFADQGITGGCSTSPPMLCPNDPVTRAQMAVFLVAAPPPLNP